MDPKRIILHFDVLSAKNGANFGAKNLEIKITGGKEAWITATFTPKTIDRLQLSYHDN